MAKAATLDAEALTRMTLSPKASTPARSPVNQPTEIPNNVPLQVRIPRDLARTIRINAAEREQSISDFVVTCVQEWQVRNCKS
jgi:vacuolar-type H+-ATPase subunit C/Vma6